MSIRKKKLFLTALLLCWILDESKLTDGDRIYHFYEFYIVFDIIINRIKNV